MENKYRFINMLKVKEETANGYRLFYPIKVKNGERSLSIQASYGHYCNPRETIDKHMYGSFEVLMDEKYAPEHWGKYYDCMGVYGYVPCEEIELLVRKLDI